MNIKNGMPKSDVSQCPRISLADKRDYEEKKKNELDEEINEIQESPQLGQKVQ